MDIYLETSTTLFIDINLTWMKDKLLKDLKKYKNISTVIDFSKEAEKLNFSIIPDSKFVFAIDISTRLPEFIINQLDQFFKNTRPTCYLLIFYGKNNTSIDYQYFDGKVDNIKYISYKIDPLNNIKQENENDYEQLKQQLHSFFKPLVPARHVEPEVVDSKCHCRIF